ncbi:MAG TPA: hypothetical protein VEI27_02975 [Dehalococcoidales bacterium]|nr:hypothetical protein [Dehalococcoidales bacterium]
MWLFKRKKPEGEDKSSSLPCPGCGSRNTGIIFDEENNHADNVKVWRGLRYFTWKCRDCGREFYGEAPADSDGENLDVYEGPVDEAALKAAEDELKREADEDGDHMCR